MEALVVDWFTPLCVVRYFDTKGENQSGMCCGDEHCNYM